MRWLTNRLPRPWAIAVDWVVTIAGAIVLVVAIEHWIVGPYRIPSASMEPTLNCAHPDAGCEARFADRILACKLCYDISSPKRGQIVVFHTTPRTATVCGVGGTYVKRLIGLPGDTVREDDHGFIWVDGKRLDEPYIQASRRKQDVSANPSYLGHVWHVPKGQYFFLGDNRGDSCDSRAWGTVPRHNLIGRAIATYWPPNRITIR
ncbi:MAG TPA: signal peptidase I [Gaiellaceae bacterium]|nr:signal peptidase I [Gaiellaceae bacterium]